MASKKYRMVGRHAEEVTVGDKRVMLAPGDFVSLGDKDTDHLDNAWLIEEGRLIEAEDSKPKKGDTSNAGGKEGDN